MLTANGCKNTTTDVKRERQIYEKCGQLLTFNARRKQLIAMLAAPIGDDGNDVQLLPVPVARQLPVSLFVYKQCWCPMKKIKPATAITSKNESRTKAKIFIMSLVSKIFNDPIRPSSLGSTSFVPQEGDNDNDIDKSTPHHFQKEN